MKITAMIMGSSRFAGFCRLPPATFYVHMTKQADRSAFRIVLA